MLFILIVVQSATHQSLLQHRNSNDFNDCVNVRLPNMYCLRFCCTLRVQQSRLCLLRSPVQWPKRVGEIDMIIWPYIMLIAGYITEDMFNLFALSVTLTSIVESICNTFVVLKKCLFINRMQISVRSSVARLWAHCQTSVWYESNYRENISSEIMKRVL